MMLHKPRLLLLVGLVTVAAFLLGACGGDDPTATPTPTRAPSAATPTPTVAMTAFEVEWEELKTAAQEEGELILYLCCGMGGAIDPLIPEMEQILGIKIINSTGSARDRASKDLAEREAGKISMDVQSAAGSTTPSTILMPAGVIRELKSLLIHPEVLDDSIWYGGDLTWMDPDRLLLAYGAQPSNSTVNFNTDLVDPAEITSVWDLLEPEWRGKIVMRDPRLGGSSGSVVNFYMQEDVGPEFLQLLFEYNVFAPDVRTAVEWLATGKYAICMFACSRELRGARLQGLPVEERFPHPLEDATISVGGSSLFAYDGAPHPNAQKLFVNWWLTREGQAFMQRIDGNNSLRTDISKADVFPENRIPEGVDFIFRNRLPNAREIEEESLAWVVATLAEMGR